eukprot:COSAG02_NODE_54_length_43941_cov_54.857990_21_plen_340_part_00
MRATPRSAVGSVVLLLLAAPVLLLLLLPVAHARAVDMGLNLPATQGTSGTGAFLPGVYSFNYTADQLARAKAAGFNSLRLPVNIPTASDPPTLAKMRGIIEAIGGSGVICMFGTGSTTTHGTGRIDDLGKAIAAWEKVHAVFEDLPNVKYEIFNEPHGYAPGCNSPPCKTPAGYIMDVSTLVFEAKLPKDRCILDALGWAQDPQGLVDMGWDGLVGYHFYPWWLAGGQNHSRAEYSALLRSALGKTKAGLPRQISNRTFITEFGGNLGLSNVKYEQPSTSNDVNCFQGLDDALTALQQDGHGVAGAFHWHGWENGDSFSFWGEGNANGSAKVTKILKDM